MKKTLKFFATLGVVAGYDHENGQDSDQSPEQKAGTAWQQAAGDVFARTGQYASASIMPANIVYNTAWGCPVGGEDSVFISGEANPDYTDLVAYRATVAETLRLTGRLLGQKTTQLTFLEVEFEYLDFRTDEEKEVAAKRLEESR